ncbi:hypothetical protein IQ249_25420 [Lusitaniella coriacea LEGE 07157]|uniref:Alpha/beta hydrolase n=1 Tax=Lusitaniella coriacea LEGE 07157 TaxID=945747 RepID=A0A8J7J735_9CYAN|nr:hypothetical protein [Lusitaniella coriacea]MBE9119194.1 hypothetical protein [Lusitaniella coriacea LEGE 07157]
MKFIRPSLVLLALFLLSGCEEAIVTAKENVVSCPTGVKFGIFIVSPDETSVEVEGEITDRALNDFNCMMSRYPDIDLLNLVDVPGSDVSVSDDNLTDTALELGRAIFINDIDTHLVDGGSVSSGGTDLLASGRNISVGDDVEIGVHSWGGGWDGNGSATASDIAYFPDHKHPEHQKYLKYYPNVGFDREKGCQFYFFTIQSATTDEMHYMTEAEINLYFYNKDTPPQESIRECP